MARVETILEFWFGDPNQPAQGYGQPRSAWFKKDPAFDQAIRHRFLADYENAAQGQLASWQGAPRSCLALVLLLDQFPRNLFRDDRRSFATDGQALVAARYALDCEFDQALMPVERLFLYLPLEHSENLDDQNRCVALVTALQARHPEYESYLDYALRHREVIQRFGRFPHRNSLLGRETTPAEAEFLKQPGARF